MLIYNQLLPSVLSPPPFSLFIWGKRSYCKVSVWWWWWGFAQTRSQWHPQMWLPLHESQGRYVGMPLQVQQIVNKIFYAGMKMFQQFSTIFFPLTNVVNWESFTEPPWAYFVWPYVFVVFAITHVWLTGTYRINCWHRTLLCSKMIKLTTKLSLLTSMRTEFFQCNVHFCSCWPQCFHADWCQRTCPMAFYVDCHRFNHGMSFWMSVW